MFCGGVCFASQTSVPFPAGEGTRHCARQNRLPNPREPRLPCKGRCRENRLRFTRRRGWEKIISIQQQPPILTTIPQSRNRDSSPCRGAENTTGREPRTPSGGLIKRLVCTIAASPHPSLTTFVPPSPLGKGTRGFPLAEKHFVFVTATFVATKPVVITK